MHRQAEQAVERREGTSRNDVERLANSGRAAGNDELFITSGPDVRLNDQAISSDVREFVERIQSGAFEEAAGQDASVIDRATGERFRREFLSVGASRPALESFVAFRGRKPEPEALLRSHGLA